jgi:hypothetical protein
MKPLQGNPIDVALLGQIHDWTSDNGNILIWYDGPLLWTGRLPDDRPYIVSAADWSEDRLTDRHVLYVFDQPTFEDVLNQLNDHSAFMNPQLSRCSTIYVVDWRMHKDDYRPLAAVQLSTFEELDAFDSKLHPEHDAKLVYGD